MEKCYAYADSEQRSQAKPAQPQPSQASSSSPSRQHGTATWSQPAHTLSPCLLHQEGGHSGRGGLPLSRAMAWRRRGWDGGGERDRRPAGSFGWEAAQAGDRDLTDPFIIHPSSRSLQRHLKEKKLETGLVVPRVAGVPRVRRLPCGCVWRGRRGEEAWRISLSGVRAASLF